jgi:hypothetical protein
MKNLLLIVLALGLSVTACSKKSSSTSVQTQTPNNDDPYYGNGGDHDIWSGRVTITNQSTYKNFLQTAFGYQYEQKYTYTASCNLDLLRWIFDGGKIVDCNSGNNALLNLASAPASIELVFLSNNRVEGLWLVNPQYGGYEIPFQGTMTQLSDGRYVVNAGALALVTTRDSSGNVRRDNFDTLYIWTNSSGARYYTRFGNVTIR